MEIFLLVDNTKKGSELDMEFVSLNKDHLNHNGIQ